MNSIKVYQADEHRWNVSYGSFILASFTEETRANHFISTDLCKMLIENLEIENEYQDQDECGYSNCNCNRGCNS